jgi:hypothetical protein
VVEGAPLRALDKHDYTTERIWTHHACIGAHPIIWMRDPLLGWQQRNRGLQRVQAEALTWWEMELAALQLEQVANLVVARALSAYFFDANAQVE